MQTPEQIQTTDMGYLDISEKWLDNIRARKTDGYYKECLRAVKRTLEKWGNPVANEITISDVEEHLNELAEESSNWVANYDLRLLKALFNYARHPKRRWIQENPAVGINPFPVEKKLKYIPPKSDVNKVLLKADPMARVYLETVMDTMARISEINRLQWDRDVDLENRVIILRTKKKRNSDYTPRRHHMNERLYRNIKHLSENRVEGQVYVFENPKIYTHERFVKVSGESHQPYLYRSKLLKRLCKDAKVKEFGYHALRHYGASLLADKNVPISVIILSKPPALPGDS